MKQGLKIAAEIKSIKYLIARALMKQELTCEKHEEGNVVFPEL